MKDEPRSAAMKSGHRNQWIQGRQFHKDKEQKQFERSQRGGDDDEEEDEGEEEDEDTYELKSCSSSTGCGMVLRPDPLGRWWEDPAEFWLYDDDPEGGILVDDPSYEYQSDPDHEILEYSSEASGDEQISKRDDMNIDESGPAEVQEWLFKVTGPDPPEFDIEFQPLDSPLGVPLYFRTGRVCTVNSAAFDKTLLRLEHVGGPGCRHYEAYVGKHISVEEMRGCHTVQGILWKKPGLKPRSDDLEFERESSYFLTGIAEKMPPSGSWLDFYPVRYGADNYIEAETNFVLETTQEQLRSVALPFHPTCFELYIQATRLYNNRVDLDTLVHIRDEAAIERKNFPTKCNQDVEDATDQVWRHKVGHEYLVANPVFVPGLRAILESAISTDKNFSVHESAFGKRPQHDGLSPQDPFLALPPEIILGISTSLNSSEVASIRLSSRAFTHLPISLFRQFVLDEMPWLYEAWSPETKPYYWATVVARDLLDEKQERAKFNRGLEKRREVIRNHEPGIYNEFVTNEPEWESPERPGWQEILDMGPITLPRDKTNWYKVFCDIRSNWSSLKGLRNRERIWENVKQVVDAIKKVREGLGFYLDEDDDNKDKDAGDDNGN
ncbi:hypothetical protein N7474_005191 [Penicillium riverlandense]|uniref:uncharacterized protein n=1 Tax=Penicillium riverlandense TaxID=1903569 RepID=UPI002547363A|nr:uncharacterized protein N7474_005191 [Penicillium riverlandense]KAJ5819600.1 hypothetical protein N7474_005191 [Penicillium riverlandense]